MLSLSNAGPVPDIANRTPFPGELGSALRILSVQCSGCSLELDLGCKMGAPWKGSSQNKVETQLFVGHMDAWVIFSFLFFLVLTTHQALF